MEQPMKQKLHDWLRKQTLKLIMWAAEDRIMTLARDEGYIAGKSSSRVECSLLREQMKALQILDEQYQGRDKYLGKIIVAASVRGQDFVQIIDVPPRFSLDEWKRMVLDIKRKFGAEVRYCDVPSSLRFMKDELVGVSKPLR